MLVNITQQKYGARLQLPPQDGGERNTPLNRGISLIFFYTTEIAMFP
jgi:hypothetical protein